MSEPATRMRAHDRKATIIAAARSTFARGGFHGTSTAEIAQAAGCSEPTLYKHFTSKEAIFTETLAVVQAELNAGFASVLDHPGDPIALWLDSLPSVLADPRYLEMVSLRCLAVTIDSPEIIAKLVANQQASLASMRAIWERCVALGTIRADIDPEYLLWAWQGIVLSGMFRNRIEPDGFERMLPVARQFVNDLRP